MSNRALAPDPVRSTPTRRSAASELTHGGIAEMEWEAEPGAEVEECTLPTTSKTAVSHAELEVHGDHVLIFDENSARALVTHWLLKELAPMLGIDPKKIEIHVDADAESRNNARQTTGLIEDGTIYIHPRGFDPETKAGRLLLAHETVHVAQRLIAPPVVQDKQRAHTAAEGEAAVIARAFSEGAAFTRPQSSLAALVTAAAEDAPPALSASVPIGRAREIAEIHRILSGLWISDGDVFEVMRILDTMAFAVGRQVVCSLEGDAYSLADNINEPHLGPHTSSVVATYSALSKQDLVKAMDLDVFGEGTWGSMTPEVKQAAREVLSRLEPKQQLELARSKNRLDIQMLTSGAAVFAEPTAEREARDKKVREQEAKLAEGRVAIAKLDGDDSAKMLLQQVRDALLGALGEESTGLPQRAVNALELLTPYKDTTMLSWVAEKLDADGLVDQLVQQLPDTYFESEPSAMTLLGLVRARLASKNIELIVNLLSYGFFDWAIRDYEAIFAYRILSSLSLAEQYRFQQIEGGKYYLRLRSHLPSQVTASPGYRDIEIHKTSTDDLKKIKSTLKPGQPLQSDDAEGLYNAGELYASKRKEQGGVIRGITAEFQAAHDAGWTEKKAIELFWKLAKTGQASLDEDEKNPATKDPAKQKFTASDQILMETVVHDLDANGFVEELFKQLSDGFLFSEANRVATVRIMMARDPMRAAAHARDLVSYGVLDWMVTDREAYLAYLCVKALPEDQRASLIKNDAWAWKRIQGEMSEDMRQSRDLNFYVGDKEGTDRASVLGRLAEASAWTEANADTLDSLLRLAIAMTEHKFAFERSLEFRAFDDGKPLLNALVKKYGLATSEKAVWTPEVLKGTKWYEEGIFQSLRTLWAGLVFLFDNNLLLVTRSAGGVDLNLNEAQDFMGGDLMGARLAHPKKPKDPKQQANPDANKLTLLVDIGAHALEASIPDLIVDSVNFQSPGGTIEAGSVRLKGLKINAAYDSADMNQPTSARIDVDSFEMNDVLLAMREKLVTVSRFLLKTLHLGAGTKDSTTPSKAVPRGGYYFPIPFLTTLGTMIYYLFKFKGWGTDTPGEEMNHGLQQVRALDLTFDELSIDGLATSGGQTARNLKIADFALHIGMNKTTMLRAQIMSLDKQIARKRAQNDVVSVQKLEVQQKAAQDALVPLEKQEDWLIQAQHRILHEKLSDADSKKLQAEIDAVNLEAEGGQYLDIGSIDASGIQGSVNIARPIHLEGLHGEGKTNEMAAGFGIGVVTDSKLVQQMAEGSKVPTPFADRGGEFRLEVDKLHVEGASVGGGQIRSSAEINDKVKELEKDKDKPEFAGLYEELRDDLLPKAKRYEQYIEIGVSALTPVQLDDFRNLRVVLAKDPSIVFGTIDLVHAHLDVSAKTGTVKVGADMATLTDVSMPEKGLSAKEIKITDLSADASVDHGLGGWLDWKKNLTGGGLHAGKVELSDVSSRDSGLLFKKATLTGGDARVKDRGNIAEAGFKSLSVEGLGLAPRLDLMRRRLEALLQNRRPTAQEKKERDQLGKEVPVLEKLADRRELAAADVKKAKTEDERVAATQRLADVDASIDASLAEVGPGWLKLDEFGIRATGAGDVLGDVLGGGFNRNKVLERGVTFEGTGDDQQVLGHAAFGYRGDESKGGKGSAETAVDVGPVKLKATVQQDADTKNITMTIARSELASISLTDIMLSGMDPVEGGAKIWSSGATTFEGLKFAGSLVFVPLDDSKGGGYRLAQIGVTSFDIAKIQAKGLGYENSAQKVEVRIHSGTVNGIHAENMTIDLPGEKDGETVIQGNAQIGSISNADLEASLPKGLQLAHGLLNAENLGIGFLEGGGQRLSAGDLSLTAGELRGPDGWARFSLEHLSGAVTIDKKGYKLENVKLRKLVVPGLEWKAGKDAKITADQTVELNGLSVDGQIEMKEVEAPPTKGAPAVPGAKPKKESKLVGIHLNRLGVDSIKAQHLIYEDGEMRVEVGPTHDIDKSVLKSMANFKPLSIENFSFDGLDWTRDKGIRGGELKVENYEASIAYEDLKTHLKAGGALSGTGMKATFTGPHTGTATLGTAKAVGFLADKAKGLSTSFGAKEILGSFSFGENFVELNDLSINNIVLGKTTYGAGTAQSIKMGYALADSVTVSKLHVDYKKTLKDGMDGTEITGIKVSEIKLNGVRGHKFEYNGTSEDKDADGKPVTKTKEIKAESAEIEQLRFTDVEYDAATALTKFGIHVEEEPGKKTYAGVPPEAFHVSGLTGTLVNKFADGETVAKFALDISGGPVSGENMRLRGIKETDGSGDTRYTVAGAFTLSRLGLQNITGSFKDKKGKTTEVGGYLASGGSIEIGGITPTIDDDGTLRIPNISAQFKNFTIKRGSLTVDIPLIDITNAAVGLKGLNAKEGIHDFGVRIGKLSAPGLTITLESKKHKQTKAEADEALADTPLKFFAEPLRRLDGELNVTFPDVAWVSEWAGDKVKENVPITGGDINFINARPVRLGIDHKGIYLHSKVSEKFNIHIIDLPDMPGVMEDWLDAGAINLKDLVEGKINEPPKPFDPNAGDPTATTGLNHVRIETTPEGLSLGEGRIGVSHSDKDGTQEYYLELENGDGRNIIHIPRSVVGEHLQIEIPKLHAKKLVLGDVKSGPVDFNLTIQAHGLGALSSTVTIYAHEGNIENIEYGDMSVIDEKKDATVPPVGAKGGGKP